MKFRTIIRIVGLLIIYFSGLLLVPGFVALIYHDGAGLTFVQAFIISLLIGVFFWFPNRYQKSELKTREGFLIVVLFWTVLGCITTIPFLLDQHINLSFTNAFFEAFSSLTTTGATILTDLEALPKAILFYRHMLQWMGGIGIIVLAVAVMPLLGVGGMQIYRAEIPGPEKNNKMKPRIAQTAKTLWFIYLFLTLFCAICLWFAGMNVFDAICHSFSVLALGGTSTHSANIAHFNSVAINIVMGVFMLIAACNFNLHFAALNGRNLKTYWRDPEFRFFINLFLLLFIITFFSLWLINSYTISQSADYAFFQVSSYLSTSGFGVDDISHWPLFLPYLLCFSTFIGGCASSTGGGLKVVRVLLLCLQGSRELKRLVHPHAIYSIKLGNKVLPERIIESVWGFFSAYTFIFIISLLAIMATGLDLVSAFSIVMAGLNNLGAGLGSVSDNFLNISNAAKWIMMLDMLFGRLEIFTLLIVFTPVFWRK